MDYTFRRLRLLMGSTAYLQLTVNPCWKDKTVVLDHSCPWYISASPADWAGNVPAIRKETPGAANIPSFLPAPISRRFNYKLNLISVSFSRFIEEGLNRVYLSFVQCQRLCSWFSYSCPMRLQQFDSLDPSEASALESLQTHTLISTPIGSPIQKYDFPSVRSKLAAVVGLPSDNSGSQSLAIPQIAGFQVDLYLIRQ